MSGKEFEDASGLYYFGARWYDPELGLWISPDPARQFASPYAYSPNPINSIDPDGKASVGVGATFSGTYGPAGAHLSLGVTFDTDALARGDFGNVLFVDGAVGAGARMGVGASGRVRLSYSPDAPEVGRSQSMSREVIAGKGVVFGVKESFDMKSSSHNRSLEISAGLGEEWAGGLTAEVKDTKTFGSFLRELFTGKNDERLK